MHKNECLKFKTQTASVLTAMQKMQTMLVKEISSLGTGSLKIWTQTAANWNLAENNVLWAVWVTAALQWWQPHLQGGANIGLQSLMSGNGGNYGACVGRADVYSGLLPIIRGSSVRQPVCQSAAQYRELNLEIAFLWIASKTKDQGNESISRPFVENNALIRNI